MSSERSGSNLLRMMLGAHSRLAAPPPPHMWPHLTKALPQYAPLTDEDNFRDLVEDAVMMTQRSYAHLKWKYQFTPDQILDRCSTRTLGSIICSLYRAYAEEEDAEGWICKENNLFDHAHQIREFLPDSQFIYLCRDGRDVTCSIKEMPTHDQHVYSIAEEWKEQQSKCIRMHQEILPKDDATIIRYEDLIDNPEKCIKEICDFADIDYEERMLYFHETEEAVQQAEKSQLWENLSKPVMSGNKGKFQAELSTREIEIFEAVAGDLLDLLGYPLMTSRAERELPLWKQAFYHLQNAAQSLIKRRELADWDGRAERKAMLDRIHHRSRRDESSSLAPSLIYER